MQHSQNSSIQESFLNPQAQVNRCRICYDENKTLMKLCQCSGSIAYVHEACIIEWIQKRIVCQENMLSDTILTPKCEICKVDYSAKIKIGREEISKQLFLNNIRRLTTFNTLFTLVSIITYAIVFALMGRWVWESYITLSQKHWNSQNTCLADQQNQLDLYTIAKYALVWGIFPLHYLITSIGHLRKMKRILIDGSKQIIANVTLMPKEVLRPRIQVLI